MVALLKSDQVEGLKTGSTAKVRLSGDRKPYQGKLIQFLPQESEFIKVKIRLAKTLKQSDFGKPAYVEIAKF